MTARCLNQLIISEALYSIVCVCVWTEQCQWVEDMSSPSPNRGHRSLQERCRHVSWSTRMLSTPRLRHRRCCRSPRNSPSAPARKEPASSPSERQGWNSASRTSWSHTHWIQWWQKLGRQMYLCNDHQNNWFTPIWIKPQKKIWWKRRLKTQLCFFIYKHPSPLGKGRPLSPQLWQSSSRSHKWPGL